YLGAEAGRTPGPYSWSVKATSCQAASIASGRSNITGVGAGGGSRKVKRGEPLNARHPRKGATPAMTGAPVRDSRPGIAVELEACPTMSDPFMNIYPVPGTEF